MRRIRIGSWRDDAGGPMQVVSGPIGRERVHSEAPRADRLDSEVKVLLDWFNAPAGTDEVPDGSSDSPDAVRAVPLTDC